MGLMGWDDCCVGVYWGGYVLIRLMSTKVIHRFIRNANIDSNVHNRVANRHSPFENTQVTLTDPRNNRTLTLIGTTNSSTTLAYRTRDLLDSLKPDALYVQTSQDWWKFAQHTDIDNQKLFTQVNKHFNHPEYKFQNNFRGILFRLRFLLWRKTFESGLRFSEDFDPLNPGLETYFACKYALKNNIPINYGGVEFDPIAIEGFRNQPDLYPHTFLWRSLFRTFAVSSSWTSEYDDFMNTLHVRGGEAFAESIDRSRINFLVALLSKVAPKQKAILIDQRDERMFRKLSGLKQHKNIVAVVNQWHMEGIETHWRFHTGTATKNPNLSPVADMDIDAVQEKGLINEWLRDYTSQVTKSEPASWQDYQTNYHKENFEYERTRHTYHDTHEDIPEPGEKGQHRH